MSLLGRLLFRLVNKFIVWPTRGAIEQSVKEFENSNQPINPLPDVNNFVQNLSRKQYCCVLWWEDGSRADEAITVASEAACASVANQYGAKYRPLIEGPCRRD